MEKRARRTVRFGKKTSHSARRSGYAALIEVTALVTIIAALCAAVIGSGAGFAVAAETQLVLSAADTLHAQTYNLEIDEGSPYTVSVDVDGGWGQKHYQWSISEKDGGRWSDAGTTDEPRYAVESAQADGDGGDAILLYRLRIEDEAGEQLDAVSQVTVHPVAGSLAATGDRQVQPGRIAAVFAIVGGIAAAAALAASRFSRIMRVHRAERRTHPCGIRISSSPMTAASHRAKLFM